MQRITLCLFLFLAAATAAATGQRSGPGPTAKALSFVTIGSVKLAAMHDSSSQPPFDRECVLQLDDLSLSGMFEEMLHEQLTESQRDEADRFYSRPFAARYNELTLQQVLTAKGKPVQAPVVLSASETREANAFASSGTGAALIRMSSQDNAVTLAKLQPAVMSLLATCRR